MVANHATVESLLREWSALDWRGRLASLSAYTELNAAFSTSFSLEDQLITHVIASGALSVRIFTLDTGRLFEETHKVHTGTCKKYNIAIETYFPDTKQVEKYVAARGINGFYDNIENRHRCCQIRKVEPLGRALQGVDIWISGLRHAHSDARAYKPLVEWDEQHQLIKCYPLLDMDDATLWEGIHAQNIPFNSMFEQGYPSIGCAPCTRAVEDGEHPRAGRWWWEQQGSSECGLHIIDGKLTRIKESDSHA